MMSDKELKEIFANRYGYYPDKERLEKFRRTYKETNKNNLGRSKTDHYDHHSYDDTSLYSTVNNTSDHHSYSSSHDDHHSSFSSMSDF